MSNHGGGYEKRAARRVKAAFIVACQVDKPSQVQVWSAGGSRTDALMIDLSEKGMGVVSKYNVAVGTAVAVSFTLINFNAADDVDRMRAMEIMGIVRHSTVITKNEYRLGIAFVRVSAGDKAALVNFIAMEK